MRHARGVCRTAEHKQQPQLGASETLVNVMISSNKFVETRMMLVWTWRRGGFCFLALARSAARWPGGSAACDGPSAHCPVVAEAREMGASFTSHRAIASPNPAEGAFPSTPKGQPRKRKKIVVLTKLFMGEAADFTRSR